MPRSRIRPFSRRFVRALAAWLAVLALDAAAAQAAAQHLVLAVTVNGRAFDEPLLVTREANDITVRRADLSAIGLSAPGADDRVMLRDVPGLDFRLNETDQTLVLTAAAPVGAMTEIDLASNTAAAAPTPNGWGAVIGYDFGAVAGQRTRSVTGLLDGRLFSPAGGAGYASAIVGAGGARLIRLESGFTWNDPLRLRRLTLGDFVSGSTSWSRAVRLVGIQYSSDFSLRPDLITAPLPDFTGSVAVPSAVDLLVNGGRIETGEVAPGRFHVSHLPITTGVGTVSVVTRDFAGREAVRDYTVYGASTLLASGLSSFSLEAGAVRAGYGAVSSDYRTLAAMATARRGLSNALTAEVHVEAARGLALIGGGLTIGAGRFGVLSLAVSGSAARTEAGGLAGAKIRLAYERIARPASVSLAITSASREYRDVAARAGDPVRRTTILAAISFDLRRFGSATIGYNRLGGKRGITDATTIARDAVWFRRTTLGAADLVAASYNVGLSSRLHLFANVIRDLRRRRSVAAFVGVSFALDQRTTASASATHDASGSATVAEVYRPPLIDGDYGYRVRITRGAIDSATVIGSYRTSVAQVEAGADRSGSSTVARGNVRGAIVLMPQGIFTGSQIGESFAIVDAGGQAGITVLQDNRPVGRTGRSGYLLVDRLRPFEANRLGIDPLDMPDDALVGETEASVVPRGRVGLVVAFREQSSARLHLRLIDADGTPLAPGAWIPTRDGERFLVGFGGEAWLPSADVTATIRVELPDGGHCIASVDDPLDRIATPAIRRAVCRRAAGTLSPEHPSKPKAQTREPLGSRSPINDLAFAAI